MGTRSIEDLVRERCGAAAKGYGERMDCEFVFVRCDGEEVSS